MMTVKIGLDSRNLDNRAWDMLLNGGHTSDVELMNRIAKLALENNVDVVFVRVEAGFPYVEIGPQQILTARECGFEMRPA